jgi:ubiquinone/menaquinone biosynthesis C-methylase UbiE
VSDSRERTRELYSQDAREYDRIRLTDPRGALLSDHDVRLFHELFPRSSAPLQILEVGAGTGRFSMPALSYPHSFTLTDVNETMMEELRKRLDTSGATDRATVKVEDVFNLSFADASFDCAFGIHIIPRFHKLEDQRAAILEVARTIRPGGEFLFNFRNAKSPYARLHGGHATSPAEIDGVLSEAGMRVVRRRGKLLLNRRVIDALPLFASRLVAAADSALREVATDRAWDVFVVAKKDG